MSQPGAENQKPGVDADRGQTGQRAARSTSRAALEELRKHDFCSIFAAIRRGRARTLGQGLPPGPPFPGAYKYPWDSPSGRYAEFRVVFISIL